ncbi:MAG: Bax inhibitor-1/YccA family protein [Bacteroidales bacterium]|nr:Bax inhibitor-1/YccA family protein [Bacteroidales bacterium]
MNPVLQEKKFAPAEGQTVIIEDSQAMTVKGCIVKTCLLLVLMLVAAAYTWKVTYESINPSSPMWYMIGGCIVGFILAMIISFSPKTAPYLSPIYAVAEGLMLGCISALYNQSANTATAEAAANTQAISNIISGAILLTVITAFVMLLLYRSGAVKVDNRFYRIMKVALVSIMVFYLMGIVVMLLGGTEGKFYSLFFGNSILAIVINIVIVAVAAFSLMMDFDLIVKGSQMGAPKYMEWYAAFGLIVTLVWLYLEILRLLARFSSRN